jgi:hypothetical protein
MNTTTSKPTGFWPRQFSPEATKGQIVFDVVMGILMPIVCLVFDPIVFRRDGTFSVFVRALGRDAAINFALSGYSGASKGDPSLLGGAHFFTAIIDFGLIVLIVWMLLGPHLKWGLGFVAGILLVGSLFALMIEVVVFLPSLAGLVYGIGIFGFTPFFTSFVFFRNGIRALRHANRLISKYSLAGSLLLGIAFTIAIIVYLPNILE